MLRPGEQAPDFTLEDHAGERVSLGALLTHGPAILFFYPGDFTPVCTREACMMRDLYAELAAAGLAVAGISPDSPEDHARFKKQYGLDYRLLADPGKQVIAQYGVAGPFGLGVRRATFLVEPSQRIADAVRADLRVARHEAFVRRAMRLSTSDRDDDAPPV